MFCEGAELHAFLNALDMWHKHAVYIQVISDIHLEVDEILNLEVWTRNIVPKR